MEMKRADMAKPYDPKRSIWVPDSGPEGGFVEALLESEAGGKTVAMVGHEVSVEQMDCWTIVKLDSLVVKQFGIWTVGQYYSWIDLKLMNFNLSNSNQFYFSSKLKTAIKLPHFSMSFIFL
jgi:hypothetical protein